MSGLARHPGAGQLALLAGGDVGWRERVALWWHARGCKRCAALLREYRGAREALRSEALAGVEMESGEWARLEAEMRANIRLGLAAGAIVDEGRGETLPALGEGMRWPAAVVVASLLAVVVSGWYLRRPAAPVADVWTWNEGPGVEMLLEAGDEGIAMSEREGALTLLRPVAQSATMAVDMGGSARAQYVDGETGQVTIHQVYADE